ncbi:MAG: RnfABCDGE type electron transport complex subunit B [Clostridia bacterium]|nr:RnfABCDGE type electron transport complex subunit B [Clostridia bacterium]
MYSIISAVAVVGGTGLVFGCLLAYASIIFEVKKDPRSSQILEILPGANCGACGYAGCSAYASAVAEGGAPVNACSVGKDAVAEKIADIMGVKAEKVEKKIAKVLCNGNCNHAKYKYEYFGIENCIAAAKLAGGAKTCHTGCLGLGTCTNVCKFDAISIVDGIAVIDPQKCTACGLCVQICPKHIIEFVPEKSTHWVLCKNTDKGVFTGKYCAVGCIGCGICGKNCPKDAIHIENNIAKIDYSKCIGCGICAMKCPKKAIHSIKV